VKTQERIEAARARVLKASAEWGARYQLQFSCTEATAETIHYMALGALAFADDILELDRPDNLSRLLAVMDRHNDEAETTEQPE